MKTIKTVLLVVIMMAISTLVPRVAMAQTDDIFGGKPKKEKTDKGKTDKVKSDVTGDEKPEKIKEENNEKSVYFLPDFALGFNLRRGLTFGGGFRLTPADTKFVPHYFSWNWSCPLTKGKTYTALGMSYRIYPIKGRFWKNVFFGFDLDYFYKSKFSLYVELFQGGNVSNTIGGPDAFWQTKKLAFTPKFGISIPARNWKFGFNFGGLVGYWNYDADAEKFGVCKRNYILNFEISTTFITKKYRAFRESN